MKVQLSMLVCCTLAVACGKSEDESNIENLEDGTWITDCHVEEEDDEEHHDEDEGDEGEENEDEGEEEEDEESTSLNLQSDEDDDEEGADEEGEGDEEGDDEEDDEESYIREQADFSEGNLTFTMFQYRDSGCASAWQTIEVIGSYKAGEEAASGTDVEGATPIDFTIDQVYFTAHDEQIVQYLGEVCEGLETDVRYDFSQCEMEDGEGPPEPGETQYTIFRATDTQLFFGDSAGETDDGDTPQTRESALSDEPMTKQ